MKAYVRRTSAPGGTPATEEQFDDFATLIAWVKGQGYPVILLVEPDPNSQTSPAEDVLQVEVWDEANR